MKSLALFVTATFFGGLGAFVGSIAGNAFGALFVGAYIGGALFVPLAGHVAMRRRWIEPAQFYPVVIGSVVGFLVAATVATNKQVMQSAIGPLSATLITGLGALAGTRFRTKTKES